MCISVTAASVPRLSWELEKGVTAPLPHWELENGAHHTLSHCVSWRRVHCCHNGSWKRGCLFQWFFSWVTGAANADTAEVDRVSVQNLIILENYLQREIRVVQLPPLGNSRRQSSLHAEETMYIDLNKASNQTLIS